MGLVARRYDWRRSSSAEQEGCGEVKVLVATEETQGQRRNDFCFVPEGELVYASARCSKGLVDDACGCSRSLSGISCGKATTTVRVVEREMTRDDLAAAIKEAMKRGGWKVNDETVAKMAHRLVHLAMPYRVGTVLECRGGVAKERLRG